MRISTACLLGVLLPGLSISLQAHAQSAGEPPKVAAQPSRAEGIPPRSAPTDYQAQAKAGDITIAADFAGHSVPTPEATLSTDDYVVVEIAFFGPPGSKLKLS